MNKSFLVKIFTLTSVLILGFMFFSTVSAHHFPFNFKNVDIKLDSCRRTSWSAYQLPGLYPGEWVHYDDYEFECANNITVKVTTKKADGIMFGCRGTISGPNMEPLQAVCDQ